MIVHIVFIYGVLGHVGDSDLITDICILILCYNVVLIIESGEQINLVFIYICFQINQHQRKENEKSKQRLKYLFTDTGVVCILHTFSTVLRQEAYMYM